MYNASGNPSLLNLIFNSNSAEYGGGMFNYTNSNPTLTNVILMQMHRVLAAEGWPTPAVARSLQCDL